jgi:hypothetical protein
MRVILGGVAGGIVMFVWGAISHMALPLGEAGLRSMPQDKEPAVLDAMRGAMSERAIYFFPGMEMGRQPTPEEQKAWEAKAKAGPIGIVVYNPGPGEALSPRQLLTELGFNALACVAAAFVLLHVPASYGFARRAALVAALGLYATFAIDASQWNWYGFPTAYFAAQVVDGVVGAALAGLAVAWIVKGA